MHEQLFTQALGLTAPWTVERIAFDEPAKRIDLYVAYEGSRCTCSVCEAEQQPIHDRRLRSWRHLDFFQYEAYIHCELPRVGCESCGKTTQLTVPWARAGSRFTLMFEAFALMLVREMPVSAASRILCTSDGALWRQIDAHVTAARAKESHADVTVLGIDETACRRGHDYITLVHDLEARRLLFATPGRNAATVAAAVDDLVAHSGVPTQINTVCMDMSRAYISGVHTHLPNAAIAFDRFHVIQLVNAAVDEVRREEVKQEPQLKQKRWALLKDAKNWTKKQITDMHYLTRMRLKTARAWRMKEALRDIYRTCSDIHQAKVELTAWVSWAKRSRLEPMKKLAETLKSHWDGVLHAFGAAHLHNGYVEAVNSLVQAAKARARGYGTDNHFIAMCYLIAGKLKHLPANPFAAPRHAE